MLYTGPARSRVSVSCTLLEGTGSSPSQGRLRVFEYFQNTLPTSEKLSAAIHLIAIWFLLQCFSILGAPGNLGMFCSFYEKSDFQGVQGSKEDVAVVHHLSTDKNKYVTL